MIWPILGGIASALIGARSADRAADAQVQAGNQQLQLGREQIDLTRDLYDRQMGRADNALAQFMGAPQPDTGAFLSPQDFNGGVSVGGSGIIGQTLQDQLRAAQGQYDMQTGAARDMRREAMRGAGLTRDEAYRLAGRGYRAATGVADDVLAQQMGETGPYAQAGRRANNALMYEMGIGDMPANYRGFQATPGYEFARSEGLRGIEGAAAAGGDLMSGRTLRDLTTFGTGLADQEYDQHLARLGATAGMGANVAGARAGYVGGWGNANTGAINTNMAYRQGANDTLGAARAATAGQQGVMDYNAAGALGASRYGAYGTAGANYGNALNSWLNAGQNAGNAYLSGNANANAFMGNALANIGDARSAGAVGVGNAINTGIGNVLGAWNYWNPQKGAAA